MTIADLDDQSIQFFHELDLEIERIKEEENELKALTHAREKVRKQLLLWKTHLTTYKFVDVAEEIHFFKVTKPAMAARFHFYDFAFDLVVNEPIGDTERIKAYYLLQREYYESELGKWRKLYAYVSSGDTHKDKLYFTRQHLADVNADSAFSSRCDTMLARCIAGRSTLTFIEDRIRSKPNADGLRWTASKSALIELLYALHASGVLNKGEADLKHVTRELESFFNISLGNVYRVFQDIRQRKINQTAFLDELKEKFIQRTREMDK